MTADEISILSCQQGRPEYLLIVILDAIYGDIFNTWSSLLTLLRSPHSTTYHVYVYVCALLDKDTTLAPNCIIFKPDYGSQRP